jgi:serum/glucocorticoid-regulated kinase 2
MESIEVIDRMKPSVKKMFDKVIGKNETFYWSGQIMKVNKKGKEQSRDFAITDKYLYNLGRKGNFLINWFTCSVKRKIPIAKIDAVSYSSILDFFVIHLPQEYDYYLFTPLRDEMLSYLIRVRNNIKDLPTLQLFVVQEADLRKYSKTDTEKLDKWPTHVPSIEMSLSNFESVIAERKKKIKEQIDKTEVIFSQKGEKVNQGSFELLKTLGKGYYGRVFLCKKKNNNQLYAMKVISKLDIIKRNFFKNLENEKSILEIVRNPFVVNLDYCFASPSYIFFVMDFKQGGELYHHLRQKTRFSEDTARFYGAQILLGLIYLHSVDIMYRDMKPENILLDANGNASLADYGISKFLKEGEKTKSFVGTPDYVSPEIILQKGHNKTVDIWCFGIILYEMIYGIPPFYNKQQNVMLNNIIKKNPSFPKLIKISPEIEDLITKCLIKQPEKRIGANDISLIKKHPWFAKIDWKKMENLELEPPIKPEIRDILDTDNFNVPSKVEPKLNELSEANQSVIKKYENKFESF